MMTNFAKSEPITLTVVETSTPTNTFLLSGDAMLNLWGGDRGSIVMDETEFETNGWLTLTDIANNLNDGQFGCESIAWANAQVYQLIKIVSVKTNPADKSETTVNSSEWVEVWVGLIEPNPTQGKTGITPVAKTA